MATAKECFDDAKKYTNSKSDPVMYDVVRGLSRVAEQVENIESQVEQIRNLLQPQ